MKQILNIGKLLFLASLVVLSVLSSGEITRQNEYRREGRECKYIFLYNFILKNVICNNVIILSSNPINQCIFKDSILILLKNCRFQLSCRKSHPNRPQYADLPG